MIITKGFFPYLQGLLVKGLSIRIAALGMIQCRQSNQGSCHIRVVWPRAFLPYCQGLLAKGLGLRVFTVGMIKQC